MLKEGEMINGVNRKTKMVCKYAARVLRDYIQRQKTVNPKIEGRITILNKK